MPHITPEQIVEAYKETGIRPVKQEWGCALELGRCGCPLTALAMKHGFDWEDWADESEEEAPLNFLEGALDLDRDYLDGFYKGVDGVIPDTISRFQHDEVDRLYFDEGYKHGAAAWEAVTKATGIYQ